MAYLCTTPPLLKYILQQLFELMHSNNVLLIRISNLILRGGGKLMKYETHIIVCIMNIFL